MSICIRRCGTCACTNRPWRPQSRVFEKEARPGEGDLRAAAEAGPSEAWSDIEQDDADDECVACMPARRGRVTFAIAYLYFDGGGGAEQVKRCPRWTWQRNTARWRCCCCAPPGSSWRPRLTGRARPQRRARHAACVCRVFCRMTRVWAGAGGARTGTGVPARSVMRARTTQTAAASLRRAGARRAGVLCAARVALEVRATETGMRTHSRACCGCTLTHTYTHDACAVTTDAALPGCRGRRSRR